MKTIVQVEPKENVGPWRGRWRGILSAVAFVHVAALLLGWALTRDLPECLVAVAESDAPAQYLSESGHALTFPGGGKATARMWIPLSGVGRDIVLRPAPGTRTPRFRKVCVIWRYALFDVWRNADVRPDADGTIRLARRDAHLAVASLMRMVFVFEAGAWLLAGLLLLLSVAMPRRTSGELVRACVAPALSVALVCAVVAPLQSYLANADAFSGTWTEVARETLPPFLAVAAVAFALQLWATRFCGLWGPVLACAVAAYEYLELGPLSIGFPELSGDAAFTYFQQTPRAVFDALAGLAVLALLVLAARKVRHLTGFVGAAVALLAALSLLDAAKPRAAAPEPKVAAGLGLASPGAAVGSVVYSPRKNVLVYVLDRMSGPVVLDIFRHEPSFAAHLPGFTCFTNHVGMHGVTPLAVAGYMTGRYLESPVGFAAYANSALGGESLVADYRRAGADVFCQLGSIGFGVSSRLSGVASPGADAVHVPALGRRLKDEQAWSLGELVRFRLMPFALKHRVLSLTASGWDASLPTARERYLYAALAGAATDPAATCSLQVWHTAGSHAPYDCDRRGPTDGATKTGYAPYFEQTWHVLSCVTNLLGRLRTRGLYDASFIVVTADHGCEYSDVVRNADVHDGPVLLVKPVGAAGPLAYSAAPTSHSRLRDLLVGESCTNQSAEAVARTLTQPRRLFRYALGSTFDDYWVDAAGRVERRTYTVSDERAGVKAVALDHRYELRCSNVDDPAPIVCAGLDYHYAAGPLRTRASPEEKSPSGRISFRVPEGKATYEVTFEVLARAESALRLRAVGGAEASCPGGANPQALRLEVVSDDSGHVAFYVYSRDNTPEIHALTVRAKPSPLPAKPAL